MSSPAPRQSARTQDPVGLLVCDVDSTFLTQEGLDLVADLAGVGERVAAITEAAMRGELDFAGALRERVALLRGHPVTLLDEVRAQLVPTPGAPELIEIARASGWVCALVSGGFHEVIDELAESCGLDHVRAHRFDAADGAFTGEVLGAIVDGAAKEATLRELAQIHGVPLERTVAIGDGANDAAMVRTAGLGIAFHGKPALREVAALCLDSDSLLDAWGPMQELIESAGPAQG